MRISILAVSACALALFACSSEAPPTTNDIDENTGEVVAPADGGAAGGEGAPEHGETAGTQADGSPYLVNNGLTLRPGGLLLANGETVSFGARREAVQAAIGASLGPVRADNRDNDCGLATTSYDGLSLNYRDGSWVGYYANAPYVPTASRTDLLDDDGVALAANSTIEGEFTIGDVANSAVSGVFVGDEVRALWAGENCIAR